VASSDTPASVVVADDAPAAAAGNGFSKDHVGVPAEL
jgi:hypothetical protein